MPEPSGKEKVEGISQSTLFLFLLPLICFGSVQKHFHCKVFLGEGEGGLRFEFAHSAEWMRAPGS